MPEISIVIVNYNVKQLILACLASVFKSDIKDVLEVIVIDNDSSDGSVDAIKESYPRVKLIANNYNAGFPAANNQGFQIASGKYILMLNPDTEVFENSLSLMKSYLDTNNDVSIVGPQLLNSDLTLQVSAWRFPTTQYIIGESFYIRPLYDHKNYSDKNLNEILEVDSISGAAILFRRELLNKLIGLDEKLFWIEDVDFCYRAKQKGYKVMYFPLSQIIHHSGQSAKKNYNISISNQVFNKIKFYNKHYGTLDTIVIKSISLIHVIFKLIVFLILSPLHVIYFRKFKAYAYTLPKVFNPPKGIK